MNNSSATKAKVGRAGSGRVKTEPKATAGRRVRSKEVVVEKLQVRVGPPKLTKYERARIIGARALQLALGAPPLIPIPPGIRDPISLATAELKAKALPISIRRGLPDGSYQDIPVRFLDE